MVPYMRLKIVQELVLILEKSIINNLCDNYPNDLIDTNLACEVEFEFVKTVTHTFNPHPTPRKQCYELEFDRNYSYGYRNFRILTDLDVVSEIEFVPAHFPADKSYPSILKNKIPFNILGENILPGALNCQYKIIIWCCAPTTISYDLVKITNPKKLYLLPYRAIQHCGNEDISEKTHAIIKLFLHGIIMQIKAYLPAFTKNVGLFFDSNLMLPLKKINNDYWEADFGPNGIDFWKVNSCTLMFHVQEQWCSKNGSKTYIFAEAIQKFIIVDGMCAVAYNHN
jgi:hypothetical protein